MIQTSYIRRSSTIWMLAILALVFATPAAMAAGTTNAGSPTHGGPSGPKGPKPPRIDERTKRFEVQLIHHLLAAKTRITSEALTVDTKTTDTFIIAFAHQLIAHERATSATLGNFLKTWYPDVKLPKPVRARYLDENLTGEEFNIVFVNHVSAFLHQEIALLGQVLRKAGHPEFKMFARSEITFDKAALWILRGWKKWHTPEDNDD